ncbi:hypothetical protein Tco_1239466, partial [Tanacetum coccineum]
TTLKDSHFQPGYSVVVVSEFVVFVVPKAVVVQEVDIASIFQKLVSSEK